MLWGPLVVTMWNIVALYHLFLEEMTIMPSRTKKIEKLGEKWSRKQVHQHVRN